MPKSPVLKSIRATPEAEAWLDALVDISRRIASMDDADEVLANVVSLARDLMRADTATLALFEPGQQLNFKCQVTADGLQIVDSEPVDNLFVLNAASSGKSIRFPDDGNGSRFLWHVGQNEFEAKVAAVVPLQLNQTPLGALWVGRRAADSFRCTDLVGLSHLANQAVIVLEHASMAARLQSLAVIQERSRIAREMHDSLAQILGYLSLETQTLEALARQKDETALIKELQEARSTIKSAQADVRENILSLRTTLSGDAGFLSALFEYVEEFGLQTGIVASVRDLTSEELALSPLAETQSVRIIQEALTNVRKHGQASRVDVDLELADGCLIITIVDDGVGFSDSVAKHGHFGLQTMRERAESVGGTLFIVSSPGQGTTVRLSLPLL